MYIEHNEYWDYDIEVYELEDYSVGDIVRRRNVSTKIYGSRLPQYLWQTNLKVEKICRMNLKVSCPQYPGEYWYVGPNEVRKIMQDK